MDHIREKRRSVRTQVLVPAKVQESNGRERIVRVTDLSLEGCKIVCASGSTTINLKANVTVTFFEEQLIKETDSNGVEHDKIQLTGATPIAGEIIRYFSKNNDKTIRVYGVKFSHSLDHTHTARKIIADSSH